MFFFLMLDVVFFCLNLQVFTDENQTCGVAEIGFDPKAVD
jgi:hypothetical protein